jgi:hypothetical protein
MVMPYTRINRVGDEKSLGLRSNRRIYSIRRIFDDSNSIGTCIYKFEVRSNFFSKVRQLFDEPT